MSENIKLSYVWHHTIKKMLNHDLKSKMGIKIKEWVVLKKLEDINSLLKYTDDDFTPTGNLCYINEKGEKLHQATMQQLYNLRWYIQHLVVTEFRQPLQVQSHLEMPRILVQLGHTQRT